MKQETKHCADQLFLSYPVLSACKNEFELAFDLLYRSWNRGGKVLVCGNGGSAADAEHIVGELMNKYIRKRPPTTAQQDAFIAADQDIGKALAENLQRGIPAISLVSQTALTTAVSNDIGPEYIFAQQVFGYGRAGDVFWGISTSGNSNNVITALVAAKALGMKTLGLTGQQGGKMKMFCDVLVCAPADEPYKVQQLHLPLYHTLCAMLEQECFS